MALRRIRRGKRISEIGLKTWHPRRIYNAGGSLVVSLPSQLLKWERKRTGEPYRWQEGDTVEIALLGNGMFLVRYSAVNEGIGEIPVETVIQEMGKIQTIPVQPTKRKRERG